MSNHSVLSFKHWARHCWSSNLYSSHADLSKCFPNNTLWEQRVEIHGTSGGILDGGVRTVRRYQLTVFKPGNTILYKVKYSRPFTPCSSSPSTSTSTFLTSSSASASPSMTRKWRSCCLYISFRLVFGPRWSSSTSLRFHWILFLLSFSVPHIWSQDWNWILPRRTFIDNNKL